MDHQEWCDIAEKYKKPDIHLCDDPDGIGFVTLYALDSLGRVKHWAVSVHLDENGLGLIRRDHGIMGGTTKQNEKGGIKGKNIGKANGTTPAEQAFLDAQSEWVKKRDNQGYTVEAPTPGAGPAKKGQALFPMLAQPFKDRKHNITWPAFVQPKLNGVRCLAHRTSETEILYISRQGKLFITLDHLTEHLMEVLQVGETADGEVYVHGWTFQQTIRAVKKLRPESAELQYWIYDKADPDLTNLARVKWVSDMIRPKDEDMNSVLREVPTDIARAEADVKRLHDEYVKAGFEGAIIRNAKAMYRFKHRSADLQKYKEFIDEEFEIVGGQEGTGNDAGCIVFTVQTKDGKPFNVRPRGTVAQRQKWFSDLSKLIGKPLTVRFQELSEDSIPIFPVGVAVRDYE